MIIFMFRNLFDDINASLGYLCFKSYHIHWIRSLLRIMSWSLCLDYIMGHRCFVSFHEGNRPDSKPPQICPVICITKAWSPNFYVVEKSYCHKSIKQRKLSLWYLELYMCTLSSKCSMGSMSMRKLSICNLL